MRSHFFFQLGRFIYRFRIIIISLWVIGFCAAIPFLPQIVSPFKTTGFMSEKSKSAETQRFLDTNLGYTNKQLIIIYKSQNDIATQSKFIEKIKDSLKDLKKIPIKHEIIYPDANKKQISKDKHTAYAVVMFKNPKEIDKKILQEIKDSIKKPQGMDIYIGGESVFISDVNKQTQKDIYKADAVAAPASIITLILIFGSLIAAFLPMLLGGVGAVIILVLLFILGHIFSLSIFTINIALLLGLCLVLDYSLFIIFRYRDELKKHQTYRKALAVTMNTAGKSVFFSGLAVFISLSALLFFPINILFSIGMGGLAAVSVAVLSAITLLPAILSLLNNGINRFSIWPQKNKANQNHFWRRFAHLVLTYPMIFLTVALCLLLLLAYPFHKLKLGISDLHILPKNTESYQFFQVYQDKFNEHDLAPIFLLVTSENKILSQTNLSKVNDLITQLKKLPHVKQVNSIVSTKPPLTMQQYHLLYNLPKKNMDSNISRLLRTTSGKNFTVVTVTSSHDSNSPETASLVSKLKQLKPPEGLKLNITGSPVNNSDVLESIRRIFPYAIAWILILTYLILLILLRSVVLPLKAIVMNILSICASYGVLVYIFQEGHFHQLLNFNPQGMLDVSLIIIIFCALFGFSMDYEVFLLSRMHEHYELTKNNDRSIVFGIEKSSKIITSAALIVIILCGSFMFADDLMVKEFGLGIAIAITVDAFIIRILLVPAIMTQLKSWNWYLPKWLDKLLPR